MHEMILVWVGIFFFTLLAELQNPGLFYFLSLTFGSCAALLAHALGYTLFMQIGLFIAVSSIAGVLLQLFVRSHRTTGMHHKTNVEALVGKRGIVLEEIGATGLGQVKIEGEVWSARGLHGVQIIAGNQIEVMRVIGCHLVVQPVKQ